MEYNVVFLFEAESTLLGDWVEIFTSVYDVPTNVKVHILVFQIPHMC